MPDVLVLGGYGAVGQHVARMLADVGVRVVVGGRRRDLAQQLTEELGEAGSLVLDAADPEMVRSAAREVDAVVDCSGRESVELVEAVVAGGAHLVDVSASYAYQRAVTERVDAAAASCEVLFSVGVTPGLTNLLAKDLATGTADEAIELFVVLGVGEDHGRAARDWSYGLLGQRFADTSRHDGTVGNFTGRRRVALPEVGRCWLYRADLSDQHVLSAELGRPVVSRIGFDSRLMTAFMASLGRVRGSARLLRALEPAVPWSWLGSDRWVVAAGRHDRVERWVTGCNQSRATGIVAGLSTIMLLDKPMVGVSHLHQRTSLASITPELKRYQIEVAP